MKDRKRAPKIIPLRGEPASIEKMIEEDNCSLYQEFSSPDHLNLVGGCYVGNAALLTRPWSRIAVFASRNEDSAVGILREQWAMKMGRARRCIVGTFHSDAECEILYFVLRFGGSAVWFLGCALPENLPDFCRDAIRRGKLLIVSCFHREHHSYATARYCAHLAEMHSDRLAVWSMKAGGMIQPIYDRAVVAGKRVVKF